ncbi:class I SAM-dependent DNA methyltransferase [Sporosarcina sp. CAU 1771]
MKQAYSDFASVYDELMTDIPYDTYAELLNLAAGGLSGKKVLDIGCGTGLLSVKLAKMGGIVTGLDISPDMIEVARKRATSLSLPISFIEQPMQDLEGFEELDVAVIAIDSLNYVIERGEVIAALTKIYQSLTLGGVLLFDVHSTFKMDEIFMESPFTFDNGGIAYIWETEEGDEPHSVYSELAFFVQNIDGLYTRFDEVHYQRTFSVHEYIEILETIGYSIERIFADWEDEPPHEESERVFFQVRK